MTRKLSHSERAKQTKKQNMDFFTEKKLVKSLLDRFVKWEHFASGADYQRGGGSIGEELFAMCDVVYWNEIDEVYYNECTAHEKYNHDFLDTSKYLPSADFVFCNPPFKQYAWFIGRIVELTNKKGIIIESPAVLYRRDCEIVREWLLNLGCHIDIIHIASWEFAETKINTIAIFYDKTRKWKVTLHKDWLEEVVTDADTWRFPMKPIEVEKVDIEWVHDKLYHWEIKIPIGSLKVYKSISSIDWPWYSPEAKEFYTKLEEFLLSLWIDIS